MCYCSCLEKGMRVHEQIVHSGLEPVVWCSIFLGSHSFGGFRAIASRMMTINWTLHQEIHSGSGGRERLHLGPLWTLQRELHLLRGTWIVRNKSKCQGFQQASHVFFSARGQLPSARSNSFLEQKGSNSSTTTWRRGRSTRRSLLLRVCAHLQFHFTCLQLLQYTAPSQSTPDTNRGGMGRSRQL